jgi:ribose transport system substrate-binding protein
VRSRGIALVLVGVGLLAAACSGSGGGSTTASHGSGNSSIMTASLAKARQVQPASFGGPTIPAKAPKGIKIGVISCGQALEGCRNAVAGVVQAAQSLGWQARVFDSQAQSNLANTQIATAASWGAKIIDLVAIDPRTVQSGLEAAQRERAVIVSVGNGPIPRVSGDVWTSADVSPDNVAVGHTTADWMIANSGGKANVLILGDNEYATVAVINNELEATLKTCPGCSASPIQYFTSTQLATSFGPTVVNYLRQHPDVNYVAAPFDPAAAAAVQAIQGTGLGSKVIVVSNGGNELDLSYVKNQQVQLADVAVDWVYAGYASVDQAIRILDHLPLAVPENENMPIGLIDKSNIATSHIGANGFQAPFDYQAKFAALWK